MTSEETANLVPSPCNKPLARSMKQVGKGDAYVRDKRNEVIDMKK